MKLQSLCEHTLCRSRYTKTGYVFAKSLAETAEASWFEGVARLGSNKNPHPLPPVVMGAAAVVQAGILVLSSASFHWLGDTFIRVSVGDEWENDLFLAVVKQL
ncbi:MAG: hypothetical protein LBU24_02785 [Methanocalculaceae archaeon]|jgi:histidinol-phosphate/aromatic aminotransferase/cobyric acid decarboxylase-like protein|nr:hypothetical protein [Methanocalculaceae archaeon]